MLSAGIDRDRLTALDALERERFTARTCASAAILTEVAPA